MALTVPQLADLPVGSLIAGPQWAAVKASRAEDAPVWRIIGSHGELSDLQMARAIHNAAEHGTLPGPRPGDVAIVRRGEHLQLTGQVLQAVVDAAREATRARDRAVMRRPGLMGIDEARDLWAKTHPATAALIALTEAGDLS